MLPTFTLPKLRLVGFEPSAPGATPVPDTLIVKLGLVSLEVIVTVPLALPLDFGANVTVNVVLWSRESHPRNRDSRLPEPSFSGLLSARTRLG